MVPEALVRLVHRRARGRCEYCKMSQALQGAAFHTEHIVPVSKGGATDSENLALACPACNLHKSDATEGSDASTGRRVALFRPRGEVWVEHFRIDGVRIEGITATGRATVARLRMNEERRLRIREMEQVLGLWPPHEG